MAGRTNPRPACAGRRTASSAARACSGRARRSSSRPIRTLRPWRASTRPTGTGISDRGEPGVRCSRCATTWRKCTRTASPSASGWTRSTPRRSSSARGPHSNPRSPGRLPDRATNGRFRAGSPKRRRENRSCLRGPDHSGASGGMTDPAPEDPSEPAPSPAPSPPPYPRRPAILAPSASPPAARPHLHTGRYDGALDAIRDVIGWNTVYDPVNRRPYTALSRNWSSAKFGGFGVWLDDVLYHAHLAGILDLGLAEENLRAVFAGRTEAGNLPCLLTGRDAWVDRSQPPIGAFVLWLLYRRWGERRLLEEAWETLLANHEWWWRERDGNGNGLLEYGTSPIGDGLYRGTALAARDESSMDNSPVHDEAVLVPGCHTLDCEDVALNSLLVLDGEMLALAAAELGRESEARRLEARARGLAAKIGEALWDPERKVFANRLWSGRVRVQHRPDQLLSPGGGCGVAGPGACAARLARGSAPIRWPVRAVFGVARRPRLPGQRVLAGPHLAASQLPRLPGPASLRVRRPGLRRSPAQLRDVRGAVARGALLRGELRSVGRCGHRPARHRHLLRLGRAHAGAGSGRGVRTCRRGTDGRSSTPERMSGSGHCGARPAGFGSRHDPGSLRSTWRTGRCCAPLREADFAICGRNAAHSAWNCLLHRTPPARRRGWNCPACRWRT